MLTSLLVMNEYISFTDALLYGLIGFVFVFVGIGILIGVLYLVGFLMQKMNDKSKKSKKAEKAAQPIEKAAPAPVAAADEEIPDGVKAAIVTAIMAYYSAEKPRCEFVVKKIKKL